MLGATSLARLRRSVRAREYTVVVERRVAGESRARATVEMRVGDTSVRTSAEGDGPVHALDSAIRLALAPHIPAVLETQLVDYKVRIVDEHLGTAAITRVLMETAYGTERFSTTGRRREHSRCELVRHPRFPRARGCARIGITPHRAPHFTDSRRALTETVRT